MPSEQTYHDAGYSDKREDEREIRLGTTLVAVKCVWLHPSAEDADQEQSLIE